MDRTRTPSEYPPLYAVPDLPTAPDPNRAVHVWGISLKADVRRTILAFVATMEEGNEYAGADELAEDILRMIRHDQEHA